MNANFEDKYRYNVSATLLPTKGDVKYFLNHHSCGLTASQSNISIEKVECILSSMVDYVNMPNRINALYKDKTYKTPMNYVLLKVFRYEKNNPICSNETYIKKVYERQLDGNWIDTTEKYL